MKTRHDIQTEIAQAIKSATGADVEVIVSSSKLRGDFLSIGGTVAAVDAAAPVLAAAGKTRTSRDDEEDPELGDFIVDFYAL